ncbi:MAG: tRNA pseudouridine(55) synthase TruB, partial [Oscillospiraceae bacterium]
MTGIIILDKPQNFTSFDAVAVMRRLAGERKIGHTGTLDPMATGVLPLLLGRATKALPFLTDTAKTYEAEFRFGIKTDTGDIWGQSIATAQRRISREQLMALLPSFCGEILQTPPMYSAVSVNGQRLYQLARQGLEIPREKRPVFIETLELLGYDETAGVGRLRLCCSKGTYVRTLIEDLAEAAGTLGTMTALRRTSACGFSLAAAHTLEELRELQGNVAGIVQPVETLFQELPRVTVTLAQEARFLNGGGLSLPRLKLPEIALTEGLR